MAILSNIITPSNVLTATNTQTVTNKDLTSGTNTFPSSLATLTGTQTLTNKTVEFVDGSVAAPSITNVGDTNTGIFFPAADTIAFAEGGVEAMRIDSSANVGIGTSSPGEKLDVVGNTRTAVATSADVYFKAQNSAGSLFLLQKSSSAVIYTPTSQPLIFDIAGERMRIDSSGNVGIGTNSPQAKLAVSNAGAAGLEFFTNYPGGGVGTYIQSFNRSAVAYSNTAYDAAQHAFFTSGTERARIASTGIVTMSAYGAGAATFSAAGVISSVSDETWKTKDGAPVDPDAMLKKLEPGYWYYNDEKKETFGADRQLGFYAQNVNAAIGPEAAPEPEEGKPWGYYDRSVLAVVVMSLQKALATIESLETRIAALEQK
jgi:hypothetical protein